MASFDSILNVDEWISDYYLTNDEPKGESFGKRAEAAVKLWKAEDKSSGKATSPWAVLSAQRNELQTALSTISPDAPESAAQAAAAMETAFGYPGPREVEFSYQDQPLVLSAAFAQQAVVLRAHPVTGVEELSEVRVLSPVTLGGKPMDVPVTKLVTHLFLSAEAPAFVVVIAGAWVILAERELWPLGRYLAVDVALAVERNDTKAKGEMQQVAAALAWENIARAADGTTWWAETITRSREHSVKVSEDLRQAIRESIEIIGNDVLRRYRAAGRDTASLDGNELAKQALRYLYRILFLLFAEASPELNILPCGVPEYDDGYGLSSVRDQILIEPPTDRAANGTYLYESLQLLFRLVNDGHDPLAVRGEGGSAADPEPGDTEPGDTEPGDTELPVLDVAGAHGEGDPTRRRMEEDGLTFRNLSADLFRPEATAYIDAVGLSNGALHGVLQNLLLTRESRGKERGFVSYATLGVTQLGQVYEGLMSFTGFIASRELLEVAPHGDPSKGSWVIPPEQAADLPQDCFVQEVVPDSYSGEASRNRRHAAGTFYYRQSSRDRERSASFYSPPVITEFTVGQALEELRASGRIATADDVLSLSICEPAMGSGAFAVEAVSQLAELYLEMKQRELGQTIPPEELTQELQRVKASIALHQVYGVDLNRTAVELAEISLWLSTMTKDLQAPWFGLHLRHGNSLVGASRSTVSARALTTKAYLSELPRHHSVETVAEAIATQTPDGQLDGRVHHFLLPSMGWGAAAASKELKALAPGATAAMHTWRKEAQKGFTKTQAAQLQKIAERVELLWKLALVRVQIAEDQVRRRVRVWGQEAAPQAQAVTRAQIEAGLFGNPDGAYRRLRLVMDAWNALWFWPLANVQDLPSRSEWLAMLADALGTSTAAWAPGKRQAEGFGFDMNWTDLDFLEDMDVKASGALKYEELLQAHPWLRVAAQVSEEQAFFHWDLDFAAVMARGGFDLQIGNPPWVRPDVDVDALLAEHDPWFKLAHKPTQDQKNARRERALLSSAVRSTVTRGVSETVALSAVLGDIAYYPHLQDQRPDLYRGFMERTWANLAPAGVISLVHPESHFTEKKAAPLRAGAYRRLRRHWQFINELRLFDVHNLVAYGVHIYSSPQEEPRFLSGNSLYHPRTVTDSLSHDGSGNLPGFKDDFHHWDLRPHRDRIITVDRHTLGTWKSILEEPETPLLHTRTVYSVNSEAAAVLEKLAAAPRMQELNLRYSTGWNETTDRKKGYFDTSWQYPDSWENAILQGPHLGVSTPIIKQPNPAMKSNKDWAEVDLEAMPGNFIPATAYFPEPDMHTRTRDIACEEIANFDTALPDSYRVAWRRMAATTGYRTVYPAILPPKSHHLFTLTSCGPVTRVADLCSGAFASSLLIDFFFRSLGLSDILGKTYDLFPLGHENTLWPIAARKFLELNCLTRAYAPLWEEITGEEWTMSTPLRIARDRWHAQNQIDAIVALSLGVSAEELCMIYRTQFPVMRRYDQEDLYDRNGRKVPKAIAKLHHGLAPGAELPRAERTYTHPHSGATYVLEYPFAPLDREADLRAAWAEYADLLAPSTPAGAAE